MSNETTGEQWRGEDARLTNGRVSYHVHHPDELNLADLLNEKDRTLAEANARAEAVDVNAIRRVISALAYWDEPCSPSDPMTKLDGLISFLDAWDEAMKTDPGIQRELRAWRDQYREALADPAIRPYLEPTYHGPDYSPSPEEAVLRMGDNDAAD